VKRRRKDQTGALRLSRWNRLSLKVFGPPQVGRYEGPWEQADPDPVCPFCGNRESAHLRDTNADGKHFRRCPAG
jgi:hypothetical protein